jgi:hypothetical protein
LTLPEVKIWLEMSDAVEAIGDEKCCGSW